MTSFRDARVEANSETRLNLSATIVKLIAGAGDLQKSFYVQSSLLKARSKFFEKCLSGPWKEAEDQTITLQDDDPEILELYLQLLYKDTLPIKDPDCNADLESDMEFRTLSKLYVLAEKYQDLKTKNVMIETIIAKSQIKDRGSYSFPGSAAVNIIYYGTPSSCSCRELMVDFYIAHGDSTWLGDDEFFHPDFLHKLSVGLMKRQVKSTNSKINKQYLAKYCEKET